MFKVKLTVKIYTYLVVCDFVIMRKFMATPKDSAIQLINHVSDNATWSDIMYELYVKQKIETGLLDVKEGRTISHNEVKNRILSKPKS